MEGIKPCPFCGNENIGVKDAIFDPKTWAYCRNSECLCQGPVVFLGKNHRLTDEEVIELALDAWNRRTASKEE